MEKQDVVVIAGLAGVGVLLVALASKSNSVNIAPSSASAAVDNSIIQANVSAMTQETARQGIAADVTKTLSTNQTAIAISANNGATQLQLAKAAEAATIQADQISSVEARAIASIESEAAKYIAVQADATSVKNTAANDAASVKNTQVTSSAAQQIAQITSQAALGAAQANANAQVQVSSNNAQAQTNAANAARDASQTASNDGLFGSIIGGILSFFKPASGANPMFSPTTDPLGNPMPTPFDLAPNPLPTSVTPLPDSVWENVPLAFP